MLYDVPLNQIKVKMGKYATFQDEVCYIVAALFYQKQGLKRCASVCCCRKTPHGQQSFGCNLGNLDVKEQKDL